MRQHSQKPANVSFEHERTKKKEKRKEQERIETMEQNTN